MDEAERSKIKGVPEDSFFTDVTLYSVLGRYKIQCGKKKQDSWLGPFLSLWSHKVGTMITSHSPKYLLCGLLQNIINVWLWRQSFNQSFGGGKLTDHSNMKTFLYLKVPQAFPGPLLNLGHTFCFLMFSGYPLLMPSLLLSEHEGLTDYRPPGQCRPTHNARLLACPTHGRKPVVWLAPCSLSFYPDIPSLWKWWMSWGISGMPTVWL